MSGSPRPSYKDVSIHNPNNYFALIKRQLEDDRDNSWNQNSHWLFLSFPKQHLSLSVSSPKGFGNQGVNTREIGNRREVKGVKSNTDLDTFYFFLNHQQKWAPPSTDTNICRLIGLKCWVTLMKALFFFFFVEVLLSSWVNATLSWGEASACMNK